MIDLSGTVSLQVKEHLCIHIYNIHTRKEGEGKEREMEVEKWREWERQSFSELVHTTAEFDTPIICRLQDNWRLEN